MRIVLLLITSAILSNCSIWGDAGKKHTSNTDSSKTRSLGQTADDVRISAGIHIDLYCLDLFKPVDVRVKNGVVYYTGSVPSMKESFAASGIAWKQNGVKKVVNNLKVEEKGKESSSTATWSSKKNTNN